MKRRTPKGNRWADHYTHRAQKEKYPARSVYKLQQIQERYRILKKGQRVLDLGCAPGSWLLYSARVVGATGEVIGIDLQPVNGKFPSQVKILQNDVLDGECGPWGDIAGEFQVVLSDMAPATTGRREVDGVRSFHLAMAALEAARKYLSTGGAFICKIFEGQEVSRFIEAVSADFANQRRFRPAAIRKASSEIYVIATGKKPMVC